MIKKPPKLLKKDISDKIDLGELFPRSKPNFKTGLTKYQAGKINKAIAELIKLSGNSGDDKTLDELLKDFVPMKRGRKKYSADTGYPSYFKGIFLSGGKKHNTNVSYSNGEIKYNRGSSTRYRREIDTTSEEAVENSTREILKNRKRRRTHITANGRVIGSTQARMTSNDVVIREALYIFNKYAQAANSGEYRTRTDGRHAGKEQLAAHPSVWGMGILFEGKENNGTKKKAAKKSGRK
jgi:hypothetical protein